MLPLRKGREKECDGRTEGKGFLNTSMLPKKIEENTLRKLCSVRIDEGTRRAKGKRRKSEK